MATSSRGRSAAGPFRGAAPLLVFRPLGPSMSQKTWGGRFSAPTDRLVEQFTESISFDQRLYPQDVRASQAHARMLAEVGILAPAEAERIAAALDEIRADIEQGRMEYK